VRAILDGNGVFDDPTRIDSQLFQLYQTDCKLLSAFANIGIEDSSLRALYRQLLLNN
jgi:hypothetical protein